MKCYFFPVIGKGPQCGLLFLLYGAVAKAPSTDSRASFNDDAGVRMLSLQVFFQNPPVTIKFQSSISILPRVSFI